jgi:integral membrane protein (TIGR01906 family)
MALALPIVLVVVNLYIVTAPWFVRWEYGKASFPADPFGMTREERVELATVCVEYLASSADIRLLEELRLADGQPAFNDRELQHMDDVQVVFDGLTVAGIVAAVVFLGCLTAMLAVGGGRRLIPRALVAGSLITLGLLLVLGIAMILNWDQFFTNFHRVFFEGDSWLFLYSDTLIRLFPMTFWIDVAGTLVALLVVESVLIGGLAWRWGSRRRSLTTGA